LDRDAAPRRTTDRRAVPDAAGAHAVSLVPLVQPVLDSLSAHIAIVHLDGTVLAVNPAWRRFALENGASATDGWAEGSNYFRVCDAASGDHVRDARAVSLGLRRVLDGDLARFEYEYACPSPEERRWFVVRVVPLADEGQRAAIVAHEDVTVGRGEPRAVGQWADAFTHCAHGIALHSPSNGAVLACNPAFARLMGQSVEDVVGRPILSLYSRETQEEVRHSLALSDSAGGARYEAALVRTDGSIVPVQMEVVSVRDEAGAICYRVATAMDLTERRAAGEALRNSEARLDAVVESMSEGLILMELDGRLVHWNRAALAMHEFTSIDDVRRQLEEFEAGFELRTPDGRRLPLDEWPLTRVMRGETVRDMEVFVRRLDRTWERMFSYSGAIVADPSGHRVAFVTITDLTERERLAAQLRQAQKLEALGQLAGGVAHDFNNILTVIAGNAELLADTLSGDTDAFRLLDELRDASARATSLTAQLLAFSRSQVIAPRVVSVNDTVRRIETMLRRLLGENVRLGARPSSGAGSVRIDPGQLEQVILNLAINARDAMPHGGDITLETAAAVVGDVQAHAHGVAPGRYVCLSIRDAGSGMTPDVRAHIFEPFFTTKERGRGTGLGLATVFRIVTEALGFLDVTTEVGAGTTMAVYLPHVEADAQSETKPPRQTPVGGRETILLVEDEDGVRRFAQTALERQGYRVISASSGPEAIAQAQSCDGPIDLLVTDVVMPGMSGRDVACALRAMRPGLRVMYMSGYVEDALIRNGIAEAGTPFLHKPFSLVDLHRRVRAAIDGADPPRS